MHKKTVGFSGYIRNILPSIVLASLPLPTMPSAMARTLALLHRQLVQLQGSSEIAQALLDPALGNVRESECEIGLGSIRVKLDSLLSLHHRFFELVQVLQSD